MAVRQLAHASLWQAAVCYNEARVLMLLVLLPPMLTFAFWPVSRLHLCMHGPVHNTLYAFDPWLCDIATLTADLLGHLCLHGGPVASLSARALGWGALPAAGLAPGPWQPLELAGHLGPVPHFLPRVPHPLGWQVSAPS